MAKCKQRPIRVETFVKVRQEDGSLREVNTRDLDDAQRRKLANWINLTALNTFYRGQAVFYVAGEEASAP